MNEDIRPSQETEAHVASSGASPRPGELSSSRNTELLRRWMRRALHLATILLQPVIFAVTILALLGLFSAAQQMGFFSASETEMVNESASEEGVEYVCPMLCVPPSKEPGKCPVCGMDLKPRPLTGDPKDRYGIYIEPTARRLANIQTVVAAKVPLSKTIRAFGRISYDETSETTISAYFAGRLDELYIDYRGASVEEGAPLAVIYSPDLYSAQVELLEAKKANESASSANSRLQRTNQQLYESARRRLIEYGLPEEKIDEIVAQGTANSRITIYSPSAGTVVEKLVDEGSYVNTGQPILRLVDLSQVWLKLELFPEDSSLIRYGQRVTVNMQSQPGREFHGRVAFIDPEVDAQTQTVAVRVVVPNEQRSIRIGDLADAVVEAQVAGPDPASFATYDPELAGKWISPNHPYIVRSEPGTCPECGEALVPAEDFGFVSAQPETRGMVVLPRQAVLFSGTDSVAYVETEPGRFEFRDVDVGYVSDQQVAIVDGIEAGENVVTNAAFMIDSAFNMANKPSLIDPNRAAPREPSDDQLPSPSQMAAIESAIAALSEEDRDLARSQAICPVTEMALGSMGTPIKVTIDGRDVMICCEGCRERLTSNPDEYFQVLEEHAAKSASMATQQSVDRDAVALAMASLSPSDRALAEEQKYCPVADYRLGAMGTPIKVAVNDEFVFICCEGCRDSLLADPEKYLEIVEQYKRTGLSLKESGASDPSLDQHQDGLPQLHLPQMDLPKMDLPRMELPDGDSEATDQ